MRREASLKKYLAWLPAVCMAAVIFLFSAQPADQSTETSDFVSQLLLAVFSRLGLLEGGPEQYAGLLEALSLPVRKCAHITEYAVFYLTVLHGMGQWEQKRKPWLIKSFAVTFFYACTDEFHQLFVPGRAGRLTDVLIDCIGVSLITAALWFRFKRMEGSYGVNGTNL